MNHFIIIGIGVLIVIIISMQSTDKHPAFGNINSIVSIFNKGFNLTGGLKATTRDMAYKNALIVGPSGSGKTSTVLISTLNSIARGNSSMVILDVSGEIYNLMSGYLSKKCKIYCIDFTENSDGYNPIDTCKTVSDVQKIASILIKNSGTESKSDPYWSASAEKMLSIFLQYIIEYVEPDYRTMANLYKMIETFAGEPQKIDKCFAKTNDDLLTSYKALIAVGDKTLQSTISSALVALKLFKNPEIARTTSKTTIDFEMFRKEKSILFINCPIQDINFLAPYTSLLYEQLFKVVLSRIPHRSECSIFAILDEMITMKFQNLGLVYSNIRKYKGGIMGIVQDERMLEMAYSTAEAHAIKTNSYSKIYLPGQPHATCKILEDMIGKEEYNKSVFAASDIRMAESAIIFVGNQMPFLEEMTPFYEHWLLGSRCSNEPYKQTKKISFDNPKKLEFK
jgi:type IV secretory pathway TraG/TraD family ATPase VirD4